MIKRSAPNGNIRLRKSGAGSREQCATTAVLKCVWLIAGCLFLVSVSMLMNIMRPSNTIEIISEVDQNRQQQSKGIRDRPSNEHDDDPSLDMKLSDEEVFCPECRWNGRTLCSDRVQFLITKYNTDIVSAMTSAMEDPSCKKKKKDQMSMVDIIRYATDLNRDMGKTQLYYQQNQRAYRNKADFAANQRLLGHIKTLNLGRIETTIFVGGTNEGQLSKSILDSVPDVTFYGFEIQKDAYEKAKENLKGFPNAQILNMGWSESSVENVTIRGSGEAAGLYNPNVGGGTARGRNSYTNRFHLAK